MCFFLIMQIMHSEPNYAISHPHIIPEALILSLESVDYFGTRLGGREKEEH